MAEPPPVDLHAHLDAIYRAEAGRILAPLIRLLGDFTLAEDALHDAFNAALRRWPQEGLPAHPRAGLLSVGRFKAIDAVRRRARIDASHADIADTLHGGKTAVVDEELPERISTVLAVIYLLYNEG
jgi:RNA polymerase sigma-70 factor (ECF subfamily)